MADDLVWERHPQLERPVLIAAFRGWNDGGHGASLAAGYLARRWGATRFAEIDAENFFDFQSTRPQVTLIDGVSRRIDWPETVFYHARPEGSDRDVILLLGVEPNYRWRTFSELVSNLAVDLGVDLVITLGSLLADVPHTRESPVTGSANDATLIDQLDLSPSRYEGPTGIVGVLHDACLRAGIPSASLWAAVPHYVQLTPSPRAAKSLVERLRLLPGLFFCVAAARPSGGSARCSASRSTSPSSPRRASRTRSRSARPSRPTPRRRRTWRSWSS